MYTEPETVREDYTVEVPLRLIRKGDRLAGHTVGDVVYGHKYVTIKGADGRQFMREPIDTAGKVQVTRERETEESREATRRYDGNLNIIRELERFEAKYQSAVAHFHTRWAEWGELNYDFLGSLMDAEAERRLWARFAASVDYHLGQGEDHIDAMTAYVESLKESLLGHSGRLRGISRSTNRLSNLMEDIEVEHMVEFIREARWYHVK